MSISTKTGDNQETSTGSGQRVSKASGRVLVIGTADELAALIGVAKSMTRDTELKQHLHRIQNLLFIFIAEIADPARLKVKRFISLSDLKYLEELGAVIEPQLPKITQFIVYGEEVVSAYLDYARAVARRLERETVARAEEILPTEIILKVLNRLSDTLYLLARQQDQRNHTPLTYVSYA